MCPAWCSAPPFRREGRTSCSGREGLRCGGTPLAEELFAEFPVHLHIESRQRVAGAIMWYHIGLTNFGNSV